MIIVTHSEKEHEDTIRLLSVINALRERPPGYRPPSFQNCPRVKVAWAKSCYL